MTRMHFSFFRRSAQGGHVADGKVEIKLKLRRAASDPDQRLAPAVDVANKHVVFRSFRPRFSPNAANSVACFGELANPISIVFA